MTAQATKCPVCDGKLDQNAKEVKVGGRTIKVCCDECAEKVKASPEKYAPRKA